MSPPRRRKIVNLRVHHGIYMEWRRAAQKRGLYFSEWAREVMTERARAELA
jgi:hypothetical protein